MAYFRTLQAHQAVSELAAKPLLSTDSTKFSADGLLDSLSHSSHVEGVLQDSRDVSISSGFDSCLLSTALHQGPAVVARLSHLRRILSQDHVFGQLYPRSHASFLDRDEAYRATLHKIVRLKQLKDHHKWGDADMCLVHELLDEALPLYIHVCLFVPTLQHTCRPEQARKWLQPALKWQIIGAYAQTELGHGSNVRGIETTAHFDPLGAEGGCFVLHTPSVTARKWWPGGLAQTVTHAIVYARLIVDGTDLGNAAFMLQVRDLNTGRDLPGIQTGNIGPKIGFNPIDNGFMILKHVMVPADALLSASYVVEARRGAQPELVKVPGSNPVMSYRTMLGARFGIVNLGGRALAKATLIGIRFALTRRQFQHADKAQENPVFTYSSLQWRLLVPLASSYVFHLASVILLDSLSSADQHSLASLKDAHVQASALKVYTTAVAAAGLEEIRRSLGGHGYSKGSAVPDMATSFLQMVTVEGDSYILSQQASRRILKELNNLFSGKTAESLPPAFSYLRHASGKKGLPIALPSAHELAEQKATQTLFLERVAAAAAMEARQTVQAHKAQGSTTEEAWDASLIQSDTAVYAYAILATHTRFLTAYDRILNSRSDVTTSKFTLMLLQNLHLLWYASALLTSPNSLSAMQTPMMIALKHCIVEPASVSAVFEELSRIALRAIAPHALSLAEAWGFNDWELGTPLARADGNLYHGLVEWAGSDPMNTKHHDTNRKAWVHFMVQLGHTNKLSETDSSLLHRSSRL